MKHYTFSIAFSVICLGLAGYWGYHSELGIWLALWLTVILGILEISLSFDNAVVNASVLKGMSPFWQKMFLTIGILIAVFGMRLVFPIVIVALATGFGFMDVITLALNEPERYSEILTSAYPMIAAFGGAFLLMVFLDFALDQERDIHWPGALDKRLSSLGRLKSLEVATALIVITLTALGLPEAQRFSVLLSGVSGIILFVLISSLDDLFKMVAGQKQTANMPFGEFTQTVARNGLAGFLYLEVLDASFSFDGVIGAFAITRDIVIIMLGLAIGAVFVRSITIDLVRRETLAKYIYLKHGAMYAIGILAIIMFVGTQVHVPEILTGGLGALFIGASYLSSIRFRKNQEGSGS